MNGTLDTIVRTAGENGWTYDYDTHADAHLFYRDNRVVRVTMTAGRSARVYSASYTSADRYTSQYGTTDGRDAGKRETVLSWLEADTDDTPDTYEHDGHVYVSGADTVRTILGVETIGRLHSDACPCAGSMDDMLYADDIDPMTDADERAVSDAVARDIDAARADLTAAIELLAEATVTDTGVRYYATPDAPDTYPALWDAYANRVGRGLPVYDGASDHSVYLTASANHAFRYWHDMGHLTHALSFTPDDERTLQTAHHIPALESVGIARHSLAWWLYYADTVGQIEYSVARGGFPVDQLSFCVDYALDRIDGHRADYAVHAGDYTVGGE